MITELYKEEGFSIFDFDTYSLFEKHGILTGDKSCTKFASRLLDFMEMMGEKHPDVDKTDILIHKNEKSPSHAENMMKIKSGDMEDLSDVDWFLPSWANWEFVLHYGAIDEESDEHASVYVDMFTIHLNIKSGKQKSRQSYSASIQHEMKHYFDTLMRISRDGKFKGLGLEMKQIQNKLESLFNSAHSDSAETFYGFSYLFYLTTDDEMSAWLEQSYFAGKTGYADDDIMPILTTYKKLFEYILLWKNDESYHDKICNLSYTGYVTISGVMGTYDKFVNGMMDMFGDYFKKRFGKKMSFEKYIKGYIKILTKAIKKHDKVWADGRMNVDLNSDECEDILVKKRKERLERIKNKKEGR